MIKKSHCLHWYMSFLLLFLSQNYAAASEANTAEYVKKYPYIYHLVQKSMWDKALKKNATYFPPTYDQDNFTHATANPDFLLTIGNHFYQDVKGEWLCLRMSVESLAATGVQTIFEGTAPVGDKQADFEGTDSELFPHILGGIHPSAVLEAHVVSRNKTGRFLAVSDVISSTTLYHIVGQKELQTLTSNNIYSPLSIELEGYIHFSKLPLILPIANDAYLDRKVLYLLQVTFDEEDEDLRWIGDNPDYYRGLDLKMVEKQLEFTRGENGHWLLPEGLE